MTPFYVTETPYRLLHVHGRDRAALLHNMTTADIRALATGACCEATLVDQKGVVLDWLVVHALAETHTLVLHATQAEAVQAWLDRYVITEDVSFTWDAPENALWALVSAEGEVSFTPWEAVTHANDAPALWHMPGFRSRARLLSVSPDQAATWRQNLAAAGWAEQTAAELEQTRIAWGIPAPAHDFDARTNPWEARLTDAISDNKGCYLGQEVVARLKNYDKVQRALTGLVIRGDGAPQPGDELWAPDDTERQRALGRVTSVAPHIAAPGGFWVLAMLKRAWAAPDQALLLTNPHGKALSVSTAARWFWQADQIPENK